MRRPRCFAPRVFRRIGVADIMKAADLTHGGFYGHFNSKDDLVAQASRRTMAQAAKNWGRVVADAPKDPFAALLQHYLTQRHRDEPSHGCGFAALCNDAARSGKAVHDAFSEGLEPLLAILAQSMPGRTKAIRRRKAVAAMAALVGAVSLARAVGDPALSDEIIAAVRDQLLAAAER